MAAKVNRIRVKTRVVLGRETKSFIVTQENAEIANIISVRTKPLLFVLPKDHDLVSLLAKAFLVVVVVTRVSPRRSFTSVCKSFHKPDNNNI